MGNMIHTNSNAVVTVKQEAELLHAVRWKGGDAVEETRKKIRACLICVVTAAVIIGMVYYFHDVKGGTQVSEGTLIAIPGGMMLWR